MIATTAAVGAVATGTFSALLPTPEDGTTTAAAADAPFDTVLAADSSALQDVVASVAVLPVDLSVPAATGSAADAPAVADDVDEPLALLDKAAELAELHAEQVREQERIAGLIARGGVDGWIAEALQLLELPQSLAPSVKRIVMKESGGNPRAINNWDINARRGTPSQGLMQTIPTTYRKYVHPEMAGRPITDPVANITAGIRYMVDNYGMDTLEAGGRTNRAGHYVGY